MNKAQPFIIMERVDTSCDRPIVFRTICRPSAHGPVKVSLNSIVGGSPREDGERELTALLWAQSPVLLSLLEEALECVDADEEARKESWPNEVEQGELTLALGDRIRNVITLLDDCSARGARRQHG